MKALDSQLFRVFHEFSSLFFYTSLEKTIRSLLKFSNFTIFSAEHFTNPVISVDLKFNPICLR